MKKIISMLLCLAMIFTIAGCGGKGDNNNNNDTPPVIDNGDDDNNNPIPDSDPTPSQPVYDSEIKALQAKYMGLTTDELKWEYNSSTNTLYISGEGPMRDYTEDYPEWDNYYETTEKIVIGDKVTSIGAFAFYEYEKLVEVVLGESVEFIDDYAFFDCECLWTVNFPKNLKYVGDCAFYNDILHSDTGFSFPEGMLYTGFNSFHSAFKENKVYIPASMISIDESTFSNCFLDGIVVDENNRAYTSIDDVLYTKDVKTLIHYPARKTSKVLQIPDTVTKICTDSIEVTDKLEKIVIPASVINIEEAAIFWNYGLKYIEVDENNKHYKSVDNVLFSKDGKNLICYPINSDLEEYTVPEGTEVIYTYALSQIQNVKKLHFSEGLKSIHEYAVYNSVNLEQVGIPKSLQEILGSAFCYCDALTTVNYASTSADWDKITITEGNDALTVNAKIYCQE